MRHPLGVSLLPSSDAPAPFASPVRVGPVAGKGRGVFATRAIAAGELVEVAPVVLVPSEQVHSPEHVLNAYVFDWTGSLYAIALGHGSLYNHSYRPNIRYLKRFAEGVIEFRALRDIAEGEELVSNYNGDPEDRSPLWFPVEDEAG